MKELISNIILTIVVILTISTASSQTVFKKKSPGKFFSERIAKLDIPEPDSINLRDTFPGFVDTLLLSDDIFHLSEVVVSPPVPKPEIKWKNLVAYIDQDSQQAGSKSMITGYSYSMLKKFAKSRGVKITIKKNPYPGYALSALQSGKADIVTIPARNSVPGGSTTVATIPVDGICRWVMRASDKKKVEEADEWISFYNHSHRRITERAKYLNFHEPKDGKHRAAYISPYDSLIKVNAKIIGWDWKLFAALIHQESLFHIEALSYSGAEGMCQFMPKTAAQYGISNTLDPEQSIRGGAQYLRDLHWRYRNKSRQERINFTLATYNCGEGRMDECMEFARKCGLNENTWKGVQQAIFYMNEDSIPIPGNDSLKIRNDNKRNWTETAYYVDKILATYNGYVRNVL